ncbi:MAG: division/cell wall cluster transcriptional repressor MraZ [Rickettsiales bacterium]|jgi:MraZ protein|nr:division/cell wall cluster transcriptional repressor MraZ [Rickettsiales bacterium]
MGLFLSTFENIVDRKGRISVPSQFRNVLQQDDGGSVVLYESPLNSCLEGCGLARLEELGRKIDNLDPLSEERDALATVILGGAVRLSLDGNGRIILPRNLADFAKIGDRATFVGKGQIFELWNSELFSEHLARARIYIEKNRSVFRNAK